MTTKITIVDLELGNLRSVARAFEWAGVETDITSAPREVREAGCVIVPGQGAFRDCARALAGELGAAVRAHIDAGRPFIGLCLGMQVLFEDSEEAPGEPGLGWLSGRVRRFSDGMRDPDTGARLKVPHMGWNRVHGRYELLPAEAWFYFVHSYYCDPEDDSVVAATADYGGPFCAAVAKDNVFACQFHPEKSSHAGRELVRRLIEQWS